MEEEDNIWYCNKCLSLAIMVNGELGFAYCNDCSSTDIKEGTMEEWESLYKRKYPNKNILKSNKK